MSLQITSVEDVLLQLGIDITSVGPREIEARCPFHVDNSPSFYINARTGLWICFQCSASGSLPMLITEVTGEKSGSTEILRELKRRRRPREEKVVEVVEEEPELPDPVLLKARYETFKQPPRWALDERMLDEETTDRYGVRWDHGWVLPIWTAEDADLMGWQFKRLDFVRNFPVSIKKSTTLFGLRELQSKSVVLVESPLDVVRLACVDVPAVSSFGALVSRAQVDLLIERADEVILALDADEEGERQTKKLYPYLRRHIQARVVKMPPGVKDPGDMSDKQVAKAFG